MSEKHPPTKEHNYQKALDKIIAENPLRPGSVKHVHIAHDRWCDIYKGKFCNCEPRISFGEQQCPSEQ